MQQQFDFPTPWLDNYRVLGMSKDVPLFDKPIFDLLDTSARDYPDRPAIFFENTRITYKKLKELSDRFAGALRRLGVQTGDRVAVMMPNLPQTVIAFWGIVKAGAIIVMTNPLYMEKELITHLNDAGAKFMVTLDMLWGKVSSFRDKLPVEHYIVTTVADALSFPLNMLYKLKTALAKRSDKAAQPQVDYGPNVHRWSQFQKGAPAYVHEVKDPAKEVVLIQYTGGTTGVPKGAMLTHSNLGTDCRQVLGIVKLSPANVHTIVGIMPIFHVYGLCLSATIPAILAASTIPVPRYVPQDMLKIIAKFRPTVLPGAPALYNSLLHQKDLPRYDLSCLEICVSGSAPLPRETFEQFHAVTHARILEGYGLTEASPVTHVNPLGEGPEKDGSIGLPISGTLARIVDIETGTKTLPIGEAGELVVKGPQVMLGYWNKPEETAATLSEDGWLHTGDIATMDEDGYFFICDRKKDMVIIDGYNVYPREVDDALLQHPAIREAVTIGVPHSVRGEQLKVFIRLEEGAKLTRPDVIAWCRQKLANYKVPRHVEFRAELPKTALGKPLRRILRDEEIAKMKKDEEEKLARKTAKGQ